MNIPKYEIALMIVLFLLSGHMLRVKIYGNYHFIIKLFKNSSVFFNPDLDPEEVKTAKLRRTAKPKERKLVITSYIMYKKACIIK
jgi:hypothetical protein